MSVKAQMWFILFMGIVVPLLVLGWPGGFIFVGCELVLWLAASIVYAVRHPYLNDEVPSGLSRSSNPASTERGTP